MPVSPTAAHLRKPLQIAAPIALLLLLGCSTSPRNQERVRDNAARATSVVASNAKSAILGIRDGLEGKTPNRSVETGVNINTASRAQLLALPGVTSAMASQIIRNRPYTNPNQLRKLKILPKDVYGPIAGRLTVNH